MSELADIGTGYYGQLEVGTSQMSIDTLMKLSQSMHLSMDYIINGSGYEPGDTSGVQALLSRCTDRELKLAEEDQRSPLLLPHFSVHSLRHTFCTRMFEVESNHKAIQTIMGHAEISTTLDIYTHITEDTLKNSVQHMSEKIKLFG